ncbi:MAG TPA: hypothetical protein DEO93_06520 [Stenotrophomonas sp.]|nr:hypothetical protein [Stenotrophomonas sp.]
MAGDSVLSVSLYRLDILFQRAYYRFEITWRKANGAADGTATPPDVVKKLIEAASKKVKAEIDEAGQQGSGKPNADSAAVRVAATVSANRAMNEIWSWCAYEVKAADDALAILALLRGVGVYSTPDQFGDVHAIDPLEDRIDGWLATCIGSNGRLLGKDGGIRHRQAGA